MKKAIGSATANVPVERIRVVGRSHGDGLPRTVELSNQDIADALSAPLRAVIDAIKAALETTPPELVTDIADSGVVLTGGGALLANLDKRLAEETGLAVRIADEPLTCAVRGASAEAGCVDAAAFS